MPVWAQRSLPLPAVVFTQISNGVMTMSHILSTQSFHPQPLQVQNLKAKHFYLRALYGRAQGKPPDHSGQPQHFLMVEFSPLKSHDLQFLISNDRTIRSAVFLPKYFGSLVFCHFVITYTGWSDSNWLTDLKLFLAYVSKQSDINSCASLFAWIGQN